MQDDLEQTILIAADEKSCEEETDKVVNFYKDDFDSEILRVQQKTAKSIIRTVCSDDRLKTIFTLERL